MNRQPMKALILYSSRYGQTKAVASRIAGFLRGRLACDVVNLLDAKNIVPSEYDRILIGASIHYGHYHSALFDFIHRYLTVLQHKPSAFFSVNLTARKPGKCTGQTNAYARSFLRKSPWRPDLAGVFAGALRYPHYRWLDRVMIQLIMRMTSGETDGSKEIEYTDWRQVESFARKFGNLDKKNEKQNTDYLCSSMGGQF